MRGGPKVANVYELRCACGCAPLSDESPRVIVVLLHPRMGLSALSGCSL